jgi:hypothetical protein
MNGRARTASVGPTVRPTRVEYHPPMTSPEQHPQCLACGTDSHQVPLIRLEYLDAAYWICPQHLPILIHDPVRLTGALPGAERLRPSEHHD